ncbi:MAG: TIGR03936 family radical SAM-associated protein [Clostridia bacterium]|jgi:radical SAM-linked protein|nr:TIGR03936 family radical SAM-associated protein [Clostridia bacterium]
MMYRLRVVYGKSKDAMYISQDDTIKIFTDAFEKAMMPFVKSEVTGRIDINFAHPLTDGYTSTGEIFDMYLSEDVDTRYLVREVNKTLPAGFIIMSAEYVPASEDDINMRVYGAEYIISLDYTEKFKDKSLREKDEIRAFYKKKMQLYLSQPQIFIIKKSYDRMERLDIKSQIDSFDFNIDDSITITLSAGPRSNITPAVVMEGFSEYINEIVPYDVKRKKIYYS